MSKEKPAAEAQEAPKAEAKSESEDTKKAKECFDQLLRLKADFDNTKKRLERDKQDAIKFANEKLLADILNVMDNFDRAMASLSQGHDVAKVKQGLEIAQNQLHQVLEQNGVQVVKSVGEVFNPQFHEAVGVVDTDDPDHSKDGTIVDEVQRGYLLNGRLIRASKVRITQNK